MKKFGVGPGAGASAFPTNQLRKLVQAGQRAGKYLGQAVLGPPSRIALHGLQ